MPNKPLEVKGLKRYLNVGKKDEVHAVSGIGFHIYKGETFGLVGESGGGKSITSRTVIRLNEPTSGGILSGGQDVTKVKDKKGLTKFRHDVQIVFQDPYVSLNPRMRIRDIIAGRIGVNGLARSPEERAKKVGDLLGIVGLNPSHGTRYPHEFSDEQHQRIGIAQVLTVRPRFIICDEPISTLNVSIQAQVINLLQDLQREHQLIYLFIAHDLSMVKHISDRIGVIHNGLLLEVGESDEIYNHGAHSYTKSLLSAIPLPDPDHERKRRRVRYQPEPDDGQVRRLHEIAPKHLVYATEQEVPYYVKKLKRQKESFLVAN